MAPRPRERDDFEARHSLRRRTDLLPRRAGGGARRGLQLYACRCSRSQLTGPPTGGCPGRCREAGHAYAAGESAIRRARVPGTTCLPGARRRRAVAPRRPPGVSPRVGHRGPRPRRHPRRARRRPPASTRTSSSSRRYLDAAGFSAANFVHHALLTDATAPSCPSRCWARDRCPRHLRDLRDVIVQEALGDRSASRDQPAGVTSRTG